MYLLAQPYPITTLVGSDKEEKKTILLLEVSLHLPTSACIVSSWSVLIPVSRLKNH